MRVLFHVLIFLVSSQLFCNRCLSQAIPDYEWVKGANSSAINVTTAIASDSEGNVYITGNFNGSYIQFGSHGLSNSGVGMDIYLVKYDVDGNILWVKGMGGSGDDYVYALATDQDDNVFVTGLFASSTISFGTISLNKVNSNSISDMFLAKYDAQGNTTWARAGNGTSASNIGTGVCTDADGNVYVGGRYSSATLNFGATVITNTNAPGEDAFIVKYNASGTDLWANTVGGSANDAAYAIASDQDGHVFLTGFFLSEDLTIGNTVLSYIPNANTDIFLAKYKNDGSVLWAKSANGLAQDHVFSVAADKNGDVFITGFSHSDPLIFSSSVKLNTEVGSNEVFLAKYNSSGNPLWVKSAKGASNEFGNSLVIDSTGNIYLTGYFEFAPTTFGNITLPSQGEENAYLAIYNTHGKLLLANALGNAREIGYSIALDHRGSVYVGGGFLSSTVDFGSTTLISSGPGAVDMDMFILKMKIDPQTLVSTPRKFGFYPNPSDGIITGSFLQLDHYTLNVYSLLGKLVYRTSIYALEQEIDLSTLASGTYIFQLQNDSGTIDTEKIVID